MSFVIHSNENNKATSRHTILHNTDFMLVCVGHLGKNFFCILILMAESYFIEKSVTAYEYPSDARCAVVKQSIIQITPLK
jgi:hypothetical protein